MDRNAVMLEETKDTITVPAGFMIRMLACVHLLRRRRNNEENDATVRNSIAINNQPEIDRDPEGEQNQDNEIDEQ